MRKFLQWLCILLAAGLLGLAVWIFTHPETEGMERQKTEEAIAQAYIEDLLHASADTTGPREVVTSEASLSPFPNDTESTTEELEAFEETEEESEVIEEGKEEESSEEASSDVDSTEAREPAGPVANDPNYYQRDGVTYTPDYAIGELMGVLEVPVAGIKRGAYGGSWEAIVHDLDIWMVTVARPDYVLGETHYCIYGHNHTVQDLSFNRLKDVKPGDVFTYTTQDGVYIYDVTRFFADWREVVDVEYVNNFDIPADKFYILTCGRNEYRYKDIVVEGTLRCVVDLEDYVKDPEYYMYSYMMDEEEESSSAEWESQTEEETGTEESADRNEDGTLDMADEEMSSEEETGAVETSEAATQEPVPCRISVKAVSAPGSQAVEIACVDESGKYVPSDLGLLDSDGLFIERWTQDDSADAPHIISGLSPDAAYVAAALNVYGNQYIAPEDHIFTYRVDAIREGDGQESYTEDGLPAWAKPAGVALCALILILIALLLKPSKPKKRG